MFDQRDPTPAPPFKAAPQPQPTIKIHIPSLGLIVIPSPTSPVDTSPCLVGEIEVFLPLGHGSRRCLGIRLYLYGICTLNHEGRGGRGVEADIIYQQSLLVKPSCILYEGSNRIPFSMEIPRTLAQLDGITSNMVMHQVFARFDGLVRPDNSCFKDWKEGPELYFPLEQLHFDCTDQIEGIREQDGSVPEEDISPPSYQADPGLQNTSEISLTSVPVLKRSILSRRFIGFIHNPSPTLGVNKLEDNWQSFVDDLGLIEARCRAEIFTASGPFQARIRIPSPSPSSTIFTIRLSILQTELVRSPRDDQLLPIPIKSVIFAKLGTLPEKANMHPDSTTPALWRGGSDALGGIKPGEGGFTAILTGRFPHALNVRASTLPGAITPVEVHHKMVYSIYFSDYGQDSQGRGIHGPGALRVVRRTAKIELPACSLLPEVTKLPTYNDIELPTQPDDYSYIHQAPCTTCKRHPHTTQCHDPTCSASFIPHVAHGETSSYCTGCSGKSILPDGLPEREVWICACRLWERENRREILEGRWDGKEDMGRWEDDLPSAEMRDAQYAAKLESEDRSKI